MDGFIRQLEELTKSTTSDINQTVSDHCKHVAIKLIRRVKNGTRGPLELRYLLEDLLSSLPPESSNHLPPIVGDPYKGIKAFAKLFTGENGVPVPLKAKPKRPASIDASALVADTKRSKGDGGSISDPAVLQTELTDVQLLYDLFNDTKTYTSPLSSSSKLSISGLLSQALGSTGASSERSQSLSTDGTSRRHSSTDEPYLDTKSLREAVETLLPPAPRGGRLRDKADHLFSKAETRIKPSIVITSNSGDSIHDLLDFLDGLVEILAHLCAPIRDVQIHTVNNAIATGREYASSTMGKPDPAMLDKAIRDAVTQVERLVRDMQRDLQLFKLGITVATTDEEELRATIRREAMERERKVIMQMYGDPVARTKAWMESLHVAPPIAPAGPIQRRDLARCLIEALFKPQPLTVLVQPADTGSARPTRSITTASNTVPPIFHLAAKHLLITQNRLQAFTILATLTTIVPPSVGRITTGSNGSEITATWSERVWTLLNSEMSDDGGHTTSGEGNESHVRLANLADEVVKVLRQAGKGGENGEGAAEKVVDEEKIRSSVDRMLRLEDRVFALLHGRLKTALMDALVSSGAGGGSEIQVKGFSVSPLPAEMGITSRQLRGILEWAYESWNID